ncbi:MAG: tRNA (adenosine(37)-N6)-threonylcarbamoyltransferase complex dimerization subunit type 1 TsaB [Rhodospirillales bacterium]|jgi:tRNA threonylcarbamoyladenosine biosynthesis protein TsaB|nr:tRNA (adenosine(37)-N6)-threonylcarbamoyltransferase complex dimerization subunit type 1 TsaB [Rhodospirillales bacterium]
MKLLALDTATAACSVAIWDDGSIRAWQFSPMMRGQSEALMPMVVAVLAEAGLAFADLDGVAATVGPGAFTGLRIGLAAARAMALAAGLPCLGVTTLEAVAANASEAERHGAALLVVLDAKRADVYAQVFSAAFLPLSEPQAVLPAALPGLVPAGPVVVVGDAAARAVEALAVAGIEARPSAGAGIPDAAQVAAIAAARHLAGRPALAPEPLYLRAPDVTLSANSRGLRAAAP